MKQAFRKFLIKRVLGFTTYRVTKGTSYTTVYTDAPMLSGIISVEEIG